MKYLIALLIITLNLTAYSQNDISRISATAKTITLPFGSYSERMRKWTNNSPSELDSNNRKYLVGALKSNSQLIINEKGGTSFVGIIKVPNSRGFILYLKSKLDEPEPFAEWHGILIACDENGKVINWIYSDGDANGGNPHGNISREFTISPWGIIKVKEGAWGDNIDTYGFTGTFKIVNNKIVLQSQHFIEGKSAK